MTADTFFEELSQNLEDPMFRAILFDAADNVLTVSPIFPSENEAERWAWAVAENLETVTYEIVEILT